MTDKNIPNIHSNAFREGFRNTLEGCFHNIYPLNRDYTGYILISLFACGSEQAKREIKMYGLDYVRAYFRFKVCSDAVGKPVDEVKRIIRLSDGSISWHEFNAILMYLDSTIESYNIGVRDFLKGKPITSFESGVRITNYENWNTGYRAAELAVKLHGREAVMQQIISRK